MGIFIKAKSKKIYLFIFSNCRSFLFIAQQIKTTEVIKYHQKKALFVGKKDINFIWVAELAERAGGHQYTAPLEVLPGTHGTTRSHHRAGPGNASAI